MKQQIRENRLRESSLLIVRATNEVIEDIYEGQGIRLTLRQIYYQLVSKNIIPNTERSYKNFTAIATAGRYAGLIDWEAVEDRGRMPTIWRDFENLAEAVQDTIDTYRLPRWRDQENYVELWTEKDALASVLRPLASQYHVTLSVNRGYSSASAMKEAAERFINRRSKHCVLLYLGDHDPSGEDMVRDIADRLHEFGANVDVRKVALTTAQVKHYNPPPNPAKITDSRARAYIAKHGRHSWEVDALPPAELQRLVREDFTRLIDQRKMQAWLDREEADRGRLRRAAIEGEPGSPGDTSSFTPPDVRDRLPPPLPKKTIVPKRHHVEEPDEPDEPKTKPTEEDDDDGW